MTMTKQCEFVVIEPKDGKLKTKTSKKVPISELGNGFMRLTKELHQNSLGDYLKRHVNTLENLGILSKCLDKDSACYEKNESKEYNYCRMSPR